MKLVEIKPNEFNELALSEPNESFYQTANWGEFYSSLGYNPIYIGYIDDHSVYTALALILVKNKESFFSHKTAICPYGYLINYYDKDLLRNFTIDLKKFLSKKGIGELTINPNVTYLTSRGNNDLLIKNITNLGYKKTKNNCFYTYEIDKLTNVEQTEDIYLDTYVIENSEQASKLFKANKNYKCLYDAMGKLVKFVVCELDVKTSINKLNKRIEDAKNYLDLHKEEIDNPDVDKNNKLINEKQSLLDLLNKYSNENTDNQLLAVTCFVEFKNKATILFTDNKKEYESLNTLALINHKTMETLDKLGYKTFDSYTETDNGQKIDLIGEFTYQVK